jgi:hypothetical protein
MVQPIFFIPFVALMTVLLYAFVLFDRLLRSEHDSHRPAWEADGRPAGYFWQPPECTGICLGSRLARMRLALLWLFRTPSWVAESCALATLLRRHRLAVLGWNLGILAWFAFLLRFS